MFSQTLYPMLWQEYASTVVSAAALRVATNRAGLNFGAFISLIPASMVA